MSFISGFGHQIVRTAGLEPLWGKNERATDKATRAGETTSDVLTLLGSVSGICTGLATKKPAAVIGAVYGAAQMGAAAKHLFAGTDNLTDPKNRL